MVEGITKRGLAVRLAKRGRRGLFLGSMPAASSATSTRLGPIAGARFPGIGADIVRHGISHRLGEQLGCHKLLGRIDVLEAERGAGGLNDLQLIHITGLNAIDQAANALAVAGE